jgi:hypothetical protein
MRSRRLLMTLTITSQVICGAGTRHVATSVGDTGWAVTWLPGRTLTRSQAITAMLIGQAAAQAPPAGRAWSHVDVWAAELRLTGSVAVSLAVEGPVGAGDEGSWSWGASQAR